MGDFKATTACTTIRISKSLRKKEGNKERKERREGEGKEKEEG